KGPFDPTGRLRTTPGWANVAATIAGSRVSFAKPCVKTLVLDPQAFADASFHLTSLPPGDHPSRTLGGTMNCAANRRHGDGELELFAVRVQPLPGMSAKGH